MTLLVTTVITVSEADGSATYVQVIRGDTVQPAALDGPITDQVDLMRATLGSLTADAQAEADRQVGQMRVIAGQADDRGSD